MSIWGKNKTKTQSKWKSYLCLSNRWYIAFCGAFFSYPWSPCFNSLSHLVNCIDTYQLFKNKQLWKPKALKWDSFAYSDKRNCGFLNFDVLGPEWINWHAFDSESILEVFLNLFSIFLPLWLMWFVIMQIEPIASFWTGKRNLVVLPVVNWEEHSWLILTDWLSSMPMLVSHVVLLNLYKIIIKAWAFHSWKHI